ncbi:MAG: hypothetical protein IJ658_13575 [Kiritimatiellae bacterium]|nr:hypothetical protein [Kiritimatiellia bacterium]
MVDAAGHFRRFKGWDYAKGASLFVTLALEERRPLFGRVDAGGAMRLSPLGEKVAEALEAIPRFNPGISLFGRVVMPDHVHFNCHIAAGLDEPLRRLGKAISGFKAVTTRAQAQCACATTPQAQWACGSTGGAGGFTRGAGGFTRWACGSTRGAGGESGGAGAPRPHLWRLGYHDHLCLSRRFIDSTERYIAYNPLKWALMHGAGSLHIREPLDSPRLDAGDYWKGVGNVALLDPAFPMVSLRVSRKVADIAAVVARLERAVGKGYVVISGFISRGEQAVRDMLCANPKARFIRILPSYIPNARFRPESRYVAPFAEGRYLEIAKGNDETEFGRAACLDLNDEIVKIATAGEGLALYWRENGPQVLADHRSCIFTNHVPPHRRGET